MSTSGSVCSRPMPPIRRREAHRPAGGDHRLARDAVPQMGRAADHVTLDHRDLGAEPGGVRGGLVAGRPTTDDDEAHGHADRLRRPGDRLSGLVVRRTGRCHDSSKADDQHLAADLERAGAQTRRPIVRAATRCSGSTATGTAIWSRGSPTHSKCIPSGWRKLPPQANPCLRKMRTTSQFICGDAALAVRRRVHVDRHRVGVARQEAAVAAVPRVEAAAVGVGVADVDRARPARRRRPRRAPPAAPLTMPLVALRPDRDRRAQQHPTVGR